MGERLGWAERTRSDEGLRKPSVFPSHSFTLSHTTPSSTITLRTNLTCAVLGSRRAFISDSKPGSILCQAPPTPSVYCHSPFSAGMSEPPTTAMLSSSP